jgi:hypothetical protein
MSLSAETCIRGVRNTLQEQLAPMIDDPYVLSIVANGIDDAVAVRVDENRAIRALLSDGAALVAPGELAEQLRSHASFTDPSLRLSELDQENARLRRLLIDLHAHAEISEHQGARALCSRIWRLLSDFELARAPQR